VKRRQRALVLVAGGFAALALLTEALRVGLRPTASVGFDGIVQWVCRGRLYEAVGAAAAAVAAVCALCAFFVHVPRPKSRP
jgi:hypothetical protein